MSGASTSPQVHTFGDDCGCSRPRLKARYAPLPQPLPAPLRYAGAASRRILPVHAGYGYVVAESPDDPYAARAEELAERHRELAHRHEDLARRHQELAQELQGLRA